MKKIDDIESEPFVMPSVQHTRYFHYLYASFNMYNIPVLSTIINILRTILNIVCHDFTVDEGKEWLIPSRETN